MGTRLNRQKYGETPEEYAAMRKAKGYDDSRVAPEGEAGHVVADNRGDKYLFAIATMDISVLLLRLSRR